MAGFDSIVWSPIPPSGSLYDIPATKYLNAAASGSTGTNLTAGNLTQVVPGLVNGNTIFGTTGIGPTGLNNPSVAQVNNSGYENQVIAEYNRRTESFNTLYGTTIPVPIPYVSEVSPIWGSTGINSTYAISSSVNSLIQYEGSPSQPVPGTLGVDGDIAVNQKVYGWHIAAQRRSLSLAPPIMGTWVLQASSALTTYGATDICYGDSKFVAVSGGFNNSYVSICYSSDGTNFVPASSSSSYDLLGLNPSNTGVCWCPAFSMFIATNQGTTPSYKSGTLASGLMYSSDGNAWYGVPLASVSGAPANTSMFSICYSPSTGKAYSWGNQKDIFSSSNGSAWTSSIVGTLYGLGGICIGYISGVENIIIWNGPGAPSYCPTSTFPTGFVTGSTSSSNGLQGKCVASPPSGDPLVGITCAEKNSTSAYVSTNGSSWKTSSAQFPCTQICYCPDLHCFLAVGPSNTYSGGHGSLTITTAVSINGINWSTVPIPSLPSGWSSIGTAVVTYASGVGSGAHGRFVMYVTNTTIGLSSSSYASYTMDV